MILRDGFSRFVLPDLGEGLGRFQGVDQILRRARHGQLSLDALLRTVGIDVHPLGHALVCAVFPQNFLHGVDPRHAVGRVLFQSLVIHTRDGIRPGIVVVIFPCNRVILTFCQRFGRDPISLSRLWIRIPAERDLNLVRPQPEGIPEVIPSLYTGELDCARLAPLVVEGCGGDLRGFRLPVFVVGRGAKVPDLHGLSLSAEPLHVRKFFVSRYDPGVVSLEEPCLVLDKDVGVR